MNVRGHYWFPLSAIDTLLVFSNKIVPHVSENFFPPPSILSIFALKYYHEGTVDTSNLSQLKACIGPVLESKRFASNNQRASLVRQPSSLGNTRSD